MFISPESHTIYVVQNINVDNNLNKVSEVNVGLEIAASAKLGLR